ncbi:MAG: ABC transporter ATP-binding protein [Rubrivivax sp.]
MQRTRSWNSVHRATCAAALWLLAGAEAAAQDSSPILSGHAWREQAHWRVAVSPLTQHFRYSEEHQRVIAVALERQRHDGWLAGGSRFTNSFGQPSVYLYLGRRVDLPFGPPGLFGQISGGLLYGYRGRYEDKVPFNNNGFSPGALFTLGWQFDRRNAAAVHLLGDAGMMLQLSWDWR